MTDEHLDPRTVERLALAAQAAQQLSDLLWDALREELADPRPERVADLTERLVAVAGIVGSLADGSVLRDASSAAPGQRPGGAYPDFPLASPVRASAAGRPASAVLVDELADQADGESPEPARRRPPASIEDLL